MGCVCSGMGPHSDWRERWAAIGKSTIASETNGPLQKVSGLGREGTKERKKRVPSRLKGAVLKVEQTCRRKLDVPQAANVQIDEREFPPWLAKVSQASNDRGRKSNLRGGHKGGGRARTRGVENWLCVEGSRQ